MLYLTIIARVAFCNKNSVGWRVAHFVIINDTEGLVFVKE